MIHISHNKIKEMYKIKEHENPIKPQGIRYTTGSKWIEFYGNNIGKIKDCK